MGFINNIVFSRVFSMLFFVSIISGSCGNGCTTPPPLPPPKDLKYNYVILLDLSDRILQNGQIESDTSIISGLYDLFLEKLKDELYFNTKDEFKVLIAEQNKQFANNKIYKIQDSLYINMEDVPMREKKDIRNSKVNYLNNVRDLYKEARFSENPNDYKGANISGYLKNQFSNDTISGENTRNFLFILTDGYQYVADKNYRPIDNWASVTDLSDVSVAVVEINPLKNRGDDELNRVKDAWELWLSKMGAYDILLLNKQGNIKVKKQLANFVSKKKEATKKSASNIEAKNEPIQTSQQEVRPKVIPKVNKELSNTKNHSNSFQDTEKKQSKKSVLISSSNKKTKVFQTIYYADFDSDGLGDLNKTSRQPLPNYIEFAGDKCPMRKGSTMNNGCPDLSISPEIKTIGVDEKITFSLIYPALQGDSYNWECSDCDKKRFNSNSSKQSFTFSNLGEKMVTVTINNDSDNFKETVSKIFKVKMSNKLMKIYLDDILKLSEKNGLSSDVMKESQRKLTRLKSLSSTSCTIVNGKKGLPIIDDGSLNSFFLMAQRPKTKEKINLLKSNNFSVMNIKYDEKSERINQIVLQRNK